jgi:hypothetical protein
VQSLGTEWTVCIGNGRNDHLMLEAAALRIAVLQQEGTAAEALTADVMVPDILAALNLLLQPRRLIATLTCGHVDALCLRPEHRHLHWPLALVRWEGRTNDKPTGGKPVPKAEDRAAPKKLRCDTDTDQWVARTQAA